MVGYLRDPESRIAKFNAFALDQKGCIAETIDRVSDMAILRVEDSRAWLQSAQKFLSKFRLEYHPVGHGFNYRVSEHAVS